MRRKKVILINATGGSKWIGGLYYKKNILFSLLQNKEICSNYAFVVATEKNNFSVFEEFKNQITLVPARPSSNRRKQLELLKISLIYGCKYIFPADTRLLGFVHKIGIHWIPDFQHNRLPDCFPESDCNIRDIAYQKYAIDPFPVVLSSEDCLHDFTEFYHPNKKNIYVIRFVSYIEKEICALTKEQEKAVLVKYGLDNKNYVCVMNQFWQHKNHLVVLQAMKEVYRRNPDSNLYFVFTGNLEDYRSPAYIEKVKSCFAEEEIRNHSALLGFIQRQEQLIIMKNAEFIIQPSLFEGWGTVVEDAKVLDKTILLSDIPVHREQMNDKCILFDPYDPVVLAHLIADEIQKKHYDDVEKGIADMYKHAREYSKGFEQLLKDLERK